MGTTMKLKITPAAVQAGYCAQRSLDTIGVRRVLEAALPHIEVENDIYASVARSMATAARETIDPRPVGVPVALAAPYVTKDAILVALKKAYWRAGHSEATGLGEAIRIVKAMTDGA